MRAKATSFQFNIAVFSVCTVNMILFDILISLLIDSFWVKLQRKYRVTKIFFLSQIGRKF